MDANNTLHTESPAFGDLLGEPRKLNTLTPQERASRVAFFGRPIDAALRRDAARDLVLGGSVRYGGLEGEAKARQILLVLKDKAGLKGGEVGGRLPNRLVCGKLKYLPGNLRTSAARASRDEGSHTKLERALKVKLLDIQRVDALLRSVEAGNADLCAALKLRNRINDHAVADDHAIEHLPAVANRNAEL
jgi:hypothetical protein